MHYLTWLGTSGNNRDRILDVEEGAICKRTFLIVIEDAEIGAFGSKRV